MARPPLYETPGQMQKVIDEYFEWCDNRAVRVWDDKEKKEMMVSNPAPYTMSGLASRLGMSRRALVDYKKKTKFLPTIKKARARVEEDQETRLNDKRTFTPGIIFNLKNNFGWKDRTETDVTSGGKSISVIAQALQAIIAQDDTEEAEGDNDSS